MREIKFRAWDKENKVMVYPEAKENECSVSYTLNAWCDSESERTIIEQFTGLKDSKNVEIYEGDIVNFTYWWFDGNIAESNLKGSIVYSDELMSFQLKGVKNKEWEKHTGCENDAEYLTPFSEFNFDESDFEVIGNIHEEPKQ